MIFKSIQKQVPIIREIQKWRIQDGGPGGGGTGGADSLYEMGGDARRLP